MRHQILNLADTAACPDVFAPLAAIADVVSLPAEQNLLLEQIERFDGYFASLQVRVDQQVLSRARRLRVIVTPSTGLDHIDVPAAEARGIVVLGLKDDTAFLNQITATAELAWGLLLSTVRRLPWACAAAREGEWSRDRFRGTQLSGKTLGVLGYGRLGRMVADYGKAFRMRVIASDSKVLTPADGVTLVDFDTLLRQADVLSIHIHLTDANRRLLDAAALATMKKGAIVINTSRGAIIDEAALLDALQAGRLAGAGLDVIDGEWEPDIRGHPLLRYAREHENLVVSPHIGGVTHESQRLAFERAVGKLKDFFEHS